MRIHSNIDEDVDENTQFDENLLATMKHFGFTAADWFDIIVDTLTQFEVHVDADNFHQTIEFIDGDNCSTNQKLAIDIGIFVFSITLKSMILTLKTVSLSFWMREKMS